MPYIKREDRREIEREIKYLLNKLSKETDPGIYNYIISRLIHHFILTKGLRYVNLNASVGILECAKAEFIRTVVSPYENSKAQENCAVSELDANGMTWPKWVNNKQE